MNLMADVFKNVPGFEKATRFAKIVIILAGIVAAVFVAARLAAPYCLDLLSSSLPAVWIAVQLIVVVVWKLSDVGDRQPREDKRPDTPLPVEERDLEILPADPLDRKPSSEIWHEIPHSQSDSGGDPPESCSTPPVSLPKSSEPPPDESFEAPRLAITDSGGKKSSRVSSRLAIKKHVKPPPPEREEEQDEADDSMDATWRAIMDGGASPVRRLLRKSDTWERSGSPGHVESPARTAADAAEGRPELRRSVTFREAAGMGGRGDELLGRAEAFIKMHYDRLRVQRQESEHRRYMEMVNHAY